MKTLQNQYKTFFKVPVLRILLPMTPQQASSLVPQCGAHPIPSLWLRAGSMQVFIGVLGDVAMASDEHGSTTPCDPIQQAD